MTYKTVATLSAILFAVLFIGLLVAPIMVVGSWGIELTPEVQFMGRRLGASFLGIAVLSWLSRDLVASEGRRAIALGISAALICVAGIGVWEIARGFAATGLLLSVVIELGFAAGFLMTGRRAA